MSTPTLVQAPGIKSGKISVKPYVDANVTNMGLENYGLALYDGVAHEEQLACIEHNGVKRYLTGLNEFAPEVKLIKDQEEKAARIKEIRTVVAQLERELASNVIDPSDEKFWDKVKLLKPDNDDFWGKISLRCSNESLPLDPERDPMDMIKLFAIEAGGFCIVAKSFEAARAMSVPPKFYLDKTAETVATKVEVKKVRNTALAELQKLLTKDANKLFLICKVVDANSVQYKKTTPIDVLYDNMDRYITGAGAEKNLRRAAESFTTAAKLDMESLKLKAIVRDASFYKFISPKGDGVIYHLKSNTIMGRNPSECVEFLRNPLNEKILADLMQMVEEHWSK